MNQQHIVQALLNVLLLVMFAAPHEFAHAWVATRLGDDTPRLQGRLTLNPIAHIDWLGTLILPFVSSLLTGGFLGWGKPVITQPAKLRGGLSGLALVALAGPASNVVMAVILAMVALATAKPWPGISEFAGYGVQLSLYLGLFNLLPVPPLDGSKLLLAARIPMVVYAEIARFGFMLLIVLMTATSLGSWLDDLSLQGTRAIFGMLH